MRRPWLGAVGLFFLAPLVAEFVGGNLPVTALPALVVVAPLYGGGALLIRETARRRGWGWPAMVFFAVAYAVVEEGLATQSLFNTGFGGVRLLDYGYFPALGLSVPWTLFILGLHTAVSIATPVALVETLAGDRRTEPWLGGVGLVVAATLFVAGASATAVLTARDSGFVAPAPQLAGTVVTVVALTAAGVAVGRRQALTGTRVDVRSAPRPWLPGVAAVLATTAFMQTRFTLQDHVPAWLTVVCYAAIAGVMVALVTYWSRGAGWSPHHQLALAGGVLVVSAGHGFPVDPLFAASSSVDLISNVIFAAAALALLAFAAVRLHRRGSEM